MLLCFHHLQNPPPVSPEPSTIFRNLPLPPQQVPTPFRPSRRQFSLLRVSAQKSIPNFVIHRIADKLRSLGYLEDQGEASSSSSSSSSSSAAAAAAAAGEIFIPTPEELPKHRVGHTLDPSWSTPEQPVPGPGSGATISRYHQLRKEAERQAKNAVAAPAAPMLAETMIQSRELRRLRTEGIGIKKKLNVGKAGITEGIVNGIHERWRKAELVKIKCEDLCRMNMKRTHEVLERKTGGLVIWRSGSIIILYRGANYEYPYFDKNEGNDDALVPTQIFDDGLHGKQQEDVTPAGYAFSFSGSCDPLCQSLVDGVGSPRKVRFQLPGESQLEEEADKLLDGLGPRFTDWWGCEPLPVDADLLPAIIPEFRRPFRLLPYGVKPKLTDREMTILRRLSRPLPCHFALGRNRNLQGLAASIIKLWEKCEIAKIAVKRGVQNTNSELMVEELKRLTGGTLLSRDREFITFYRGKNFLPPAVSRAIAERRDSGTYQLKQKKDEISKISLPLSVQVSSVIDPKTRLQESNSQEVHLSLGGKCTTTKSAKTVDSMSKAYQKKLKAEKLLEELEESAGPLYQESDREAISEEERFMLRKVGLKMNPFLLLGRRGVFDGIVENMHLHWKYRELVKIIAKNRSIEDVHTAARALEAASCGILVAVEKVNRGHAIIFYRGKNYQRPKHLRPKTLLNKKEALKHYIQRQRSESLKLHVLKLSKEIERLNDQVVKHDIQIDMSEASECNSLNPVHGSFSNSACVEKPCLETRIEQKKGLPYSSICNLSASEDSFVDASEDTFVDASQDQSISFIDENYHSSPISSEPAPLSNKERLVLRKQALQMKRRPVLSVGKHNVIDGVAKTIRTHFRKYPLAIVNIKNIAEGTSVQEMIFKLERATGSVLVSREPNKVILYRGWGVGGLPGVVKGKGEIRHTASQGVVSEKLITAIKMEWNMQVP